MHHLAIIIPYYKIDFFEETLQSLAAQTDKRFTLYIGNDASPNDPKNLIEQIFPDANYYDYKENFGGKNLALQWERILENVTEEWVQILGDDDTISPNFVEEFYKNADQISSVNLIKTSSIIIDENKNLLKDFTSSLKTGYFQSTSFFFEKMQSRMNSSLSEHLFRTDVLKKIKFKKYPLAWHSDDFVVLSMTEGKTFYFIAEAKVFVKEFSGSISGKNDNQKLKKEASVQFYTDVLSLVKYTATLQQKKFLINFITKYITKDNVLQLYTTLFGISGIYYYSMYIAKRLIKKVL